MFFRFGSAIVLVVLISLAGVSLEKENLELRRAVSRQQYRMDVLLESHARLRLRTQQLGAPVQVIEQIEDGTLDVRPPEASTTTTTTIPMPTPQMPLLRWQQSTPYAR